MDDGADQQRVWPVFVLAAGVVAIGSWFAMVPTAAAVGDDLAEPFLSTPQTPESSPVTEPLQLGRGTSGQQLRATIRQVRRDSRHEVRTSIELMLVESAAEKLGDDLLYERSYSEAQVALEADGEALGAGVTREVERLVETARHRVRVRTTGELVSVELVSAEAAQLGQLLSVIEEAVELARPRAPRELVQQGESWSWQIVPTSPNAAGNTSVTGRVIGAVADGIVIELIVETKTAWDATTDEGPQHVDVSGSGRGLAVWDPDDSALVRSELRWDTDAGPPGEVQSSVWVNLVSE